jgi:hypothetical protein
MPKMTLPAMLTPAAKAKATSRTARTARVIKTKTRANKAIKRGAKKATKK